MIIQLIASFPRPIVDTVLEDYDWITGGCRYVRDHGRSLMYVGTYYGPTAEEIFDWDNIGRNVIVIGSLPLGLTPEFISDEVLVIDEDDIPGANLSVMITEALSL